MSDIQTRYLVLGAGAAGVHAAMSIRERDRQGRLMLLSGEDTLPYRRPMLSKSPLQTLRGRRMELYDADWYAAQGIELQLGCLITALDAEKHTAQTDIGAIHYEKCVYALGGYNFIPPFKGADTPGVVTVRTQNDLRALKRYAAQTDKAVVIGGGVIGLEMAVELRRYGLDVTVLEAMPRLMPRQLDEGTSAHLLDLLGELHVCTGVAIAEIEGDGRVTGVRLEDGRVFPCGVVMVSCGQKANIAIAQGAGIPCGRAVVINDKAETGIPDVWACGDCAELDGVNVALWSQAVEQGLTAGANAAGGDRRIGRFDRSLILNSHLVNLFALGDLSGEGCECVERRRTFTGFSINEKPPTALEKRFYRDGYLVGGCILGNLSGMESMKKQIEEGASR